MGSVTTKNKVLIENTSKGKRKYREIRSVKKVQRTVTIVREGGSMTRSETVFDMRTINLNSQHRFDLEV